MTYKLIAIDIDGTLLNDERVIPQRNIDAVHAAIAAGAQVMIATGRPHRAASWTMDKIGMSGTILSVGGALVTRYPEGEVVYEAHLSEDAVKDLSDCCRENGWLCQLVCGSDVHYEYRCEGTDFTDKYFGYTGILTDFRSDHGKIFNKGNIILSPETIQHAEKTLKACLGDRAVVQIADSRVIDVTPKGISKGVTLLRVAEHFGLTAEQVIAIGDSDSDITMIKAAGLGVCMANGSVDTKAAADFIAPSNNDCGVAAVIEQFILK